MLGQLHIKNIGIIDDVTVNFEDGVNILTGETGAGKSLIIDSISAITGSRISKELIKSGSDMALIEACFFTDSDNIILSREIYQNGRNICKINGKMTTLNELKTLGEELIDIHGQHDNQSLLDVKTHINLLDNFAGEELQKLKQQYIELFTKHKEMEAQIKKKYGDEQERARRIDLLKYQKDEIEAANLKLGEEESLIERRKLLMNAERIAKSLDSTYNILNEVVLEALGEATKEMSGISELDEKYQSILTTLNDAYYALQDSSSDAMGEIQKINFDQTEQTEIEERLDLIFSLKRKYGNTIEDVLKYYDDMAKELDFLENSEEITNQMKEELSLLDKDLVKLAKKIRKIRMDTAKTIEEKINSQLQDLEMKKAYIKFHFEELDTYRDDGMDNVELLICTNAGEELKPLAKIASGGEISRVMLAIKTVLCEYDNVATMIFDEIDTGISGQAGKAVAEKMKIIGKTHQIICVTHLPAIAAIGNTNYFIQKLPEGEKVVTKIKRLKEDETIREIARILAGDDITEAALMHARELRK
ncbi:MAG: DNA repair protein RecN [Clostridia bacterium]|nr:DNA repair protein RecN [Clostridia bacterium]